MTPDEYFAETGENPSQLAKKLGCAPSTVIRVLRGQRNLTAAFADRLAAVTGSKVPAETWLKVCYDAWKHAHPGDQPIPGAAA